MRMALAKIAGLRDIELARASFDLTPGRDDSVHVQGRVSARVGQTCVVSLDAIENDVVEDVDLIFVPEGRIREFAATRSMMTTVSAGRFRIPPNPSSMVSLTSGASRPTSCFWELIRIRGNPMPFSSRPRARWILRIIPSLP